MIANRKYADYIAAQNVFIPHYSLIGICCVSTSYERWRWLMCSLHNHLLKQCYRAQFLSLVALWCLFVSANASAHLLEWCATAAGSTSCFFYFLLLVEHFVDCLQDKQWPEHRKYMHWNLLIPPITVLDICIWNDIYYFIIQFTPQLIDIRYAGIDAGNWLFLSVVEGRLRSCSFTLFGDWIFFRAPCRGSLNDTSSEYLRLYNSQERICFFDVYLPLMNGDCDYSSHASAAALPWP